MRGERGCIREAPLVRGTQGGVLTLQLFDPGHRVSRLVSCWPWLEDVSLARRLARPEPAQ